jgi:hypothetical protein
MVALCSFGDCIDIGGGIEMVGCRDADADADATVGQLIQLRNRYKTSVL